MAEWRATGNSSVVGDLNAHGGQGILPGDEDQPDPTWVAVLRWPGTASLIKSIA